MSMPGSTSSGFSPCPSAGVIRLTRNGEARKISAKRNPQRMTPIVAIACGAPHGIFGTVIEVKAAMNSDIDHVQNSSDPGWPL